VRMARDWLRVGFVPLLLLACLLVGCRPTPSGRDRHEADGAWLADQIPALAPVPLGAGEPLRAVATTSIVGDVLADVGGDRIELTVLLPAGTDPHSYQPTPQDAAAVAEAHVVFANGAGLEAFLDPLLETAGQEVPVVPLSAGVALRRPGDGQGLASGDDDEHEATDPDPHVWLDPNNVLVWVANVESALAALDPSHADEYEAEARQSRRRLEELDAWIREQVAQVAEADRVLVADHASLGYFADRYGFEIVGTVFPGFSTLAEPSAQEMAALEAIIRARGVRAVFVATTVNPSLAERVMEDTGARLVFLYVGSLSGPDGPASTYVAMMEFDVTAIVSALR
jgi:manganese/iron transport system substrate-binding protein